MRDVLVGAAKMMTVAWRMHRHKTVIAACLMFAGAASAPLLAAALGFVTTQVVAGRTAPAAYGGVLLAMLAIATTTFDHLAHVFYFEISELTELDFDEQLIALSNGSPGISHHERADDADTLTVLKREGRQLGLGLEALLRGMGLLVAILLTGVLLARLHPVLLLLPLAAVPPLLTGRWAEQIVDQAKTATAEPTRTALHLFNLCASAGPAGEIRVFRLQNEIRRRHRELHLQVDAGMLRADLTASWLRAGGQVVFALAYIGAVLFVVREAIVGQRGVGDVILVLTLAAQVNQQVTAAVALLQDLQRMASMYRRLAHYQEVVTADGAGRGDQAIGSRLREGIVLDRVTFAYPGNGTAALRDVSLTLPAGATVALVGENGAGKTTLVKLLCGFYQPTQGQILVDGVDLTRVPAESWREHVATGFQDFVRYEFLARHAVGVGDLARISSPDAARSALDRAHAADVLDGLAAGLETQLGMTYNHGAELSGGQWQKIALGRALMRESPLLLVLDEPTSALDPEAEHALFDQYIQQVRRVAQATGGITVLVSHRFTSVRMADLIVVVQDGQIVEAGDHDTLLANDRVYAELFALHTAAYS
jgi:ATP-binding cassette subfamily B protein